MRKRMIDPEFWSDEKISTLSYEARLMFIGLWNFSDDEGLSRFNASFLKSSIFVYDHISLKKIEGLMEELVKARLVFSYQGGLTNQRYSYIINFRKYQRIDKPQLSKLPPPSIQNSEVQNMYLGRDNGICYLCNTEVDYVGRSDLPKSKMWSLDHIKPRSLGGSDYPSNIRIAHISCNKSKGNKYENNSKNDSKNDSRLREFKLNKEKLNKEKLSEENRSVKERVSGEDTGVGFAKLKEKINKLRPRA